MRADSSKKILCQYGSKDLEHGVSISRAAVVVRIAASTPLAIPLEFVMSKGALSSEASS